MKTFINGETQKDLLDIKKKLESFQFDGLIKDINHVNEVIADDVQNNIANAILEAFEGTDDEDVRLDFFFAELIASRRETAKGFSTNIVCDTRSMNSIIDETIETGVPGNNFPVILAATLADFKVLETMVLDSYMLLGLEDDLELTDDEQDAATIIDFCIMMDLLLDFLEVELEPGTMYKKHYDMNIDRIVAEDEYYELSVGKLFKQAIKNDDCGDFEC